jgi:hypothetical protein
MSAAALTVCRCGFNNQRNAVAIRQDVPLIKFRTPGNLVITDCPVSYSEHLSKPQQVGRSTPATAFTELFITPFPQPLTRPDVSGKQQQLHHSIIRAIIMRIPLWTQVLRCV